VRAGDKQREILTYILAARRIPRVTYTGTVADDNEGEMARLAVTESDGRAPTPRLLAAASALPAKPLPFPDHFHPRPPCALGWAGLAAAVGRL
jgi:hypothetical protein